MDQIIKQNMKKGTGTKQDKGGQKEDPFAEFDHFFKSDPILHDKCLDIISWFGVSPLALHSGLGRL